ncbi:hypothetical protein [Ralstonia solanacearum]|uniref:hypothetical protein n=1 Tax=Ralstonia solanacearum TaxID=305 RepID=UPI0004FF9BD4|nr:hypothetical protein [Ralstonia solanacearum]KFX26661.1 hypothetical protein KR96_22370 [Ralstonia solanacearum]KFX81137.1 hypothetical protein KR99_25430 [Ralstonia solanacearum]
MHQKTTLTEAADACGEASATLARYRSLLAGAANLNAPCIPHALNDLRRVAVEIECTAIALAQAHRAALEAAE